MSYILYTGEDCHDCVMIADYVKNKKLSNKIKVSNVDTEEQSTSIDVFARPALFKGGDVVAYGVDIIEYIEKNMLDK